MTMLIFTALSVERARAPVTVDKTSRSRLLFDKRDQPLTFGGFMFTRTSSAEPKALEPRLANSPKADRAVPDPY